MALGNYSSTTSFTHGLKLKFNLLCHKLKQYKDTDTDKQTTQRQTEPTTETDGAHKQRNKVSKNLICK